MAKGKNMDYKGKKIWKYVSSQPVNSKNVIKDTKGAKKIVASDGVSDLTNKWRGYYE